LFPALNGPTRLGTSVKDLNEPETNQYYVLASGISKNFSVTSIRREKYALTK
jgi:hypothetical protein